MPSCRREENKLRGRMGNGGGREWVVTIIGSTDVLFNRLMLLLFRRCWTRLVNTARKECQEKFSVEHIFIWSPNGKHLREVKRNGNSRASSDAERNLGRDPNQIFCRPSSSYRWILLDTQSRHLLCRRTYFGNRNIAVRHVENYSQFLACSWSWPIEKHTIEWIYIINNWYFLIEI